MGYKILFLLNALVVFALGAALLFVPEMVLGQFQTQMRVTEVVQACYLGAALFTLGLTLWFVKDVSDERLQKNFSAVGLIGSVLAVIVTIISITKSLLSINSWIPIVDRCRGCLRFRICIYTVPETKNEGIAS